MESKYGNEKIILFFLFCLFLIGCGKKEKNTINPALFSEVQNGDLICRLGTGFFSNKFKDYSLSEKLYSHVGIVELKEDSIFIIHAEASEFTGIGFVKREPISVFLNGINTWGVYRVNASDSIRDLIANGAKEYYQRNTPFDMDFDATNDNKVYCTELVALTINKAFGDTIVRPMLDVGNRKIYGIDNVYLLPDIQVIKKTDN